MSTKCVTICLFILLISVSVNCKMCTRKVTVITHEIVSYDWQKVPYTTICFDEHYKAHLCTKFIDEYRPTTVSKPVYETKIEKYDCDKFNETGDDYDTSTDIFNDTIEYKKDVDYDNIENIKSTNNPEGHRTARNVKSDYTMSVPECDPPCNNGICVKNVCECYAEYVLIDGICQPSCSEPCHNGTCVAPDYCECNPGYKISESNVCEPYCSSGCQNGLCVAPETCQCKAGYSNELIGLSNVCTPNCKVGFTKINGTCTPQCKACDNGKCTAPGVCTCSHGYKMNFKKLINPDGDDPACIPSCVKCRGRCIAPNTCVYDVTVPTVIKDVTFSRTVTMGSTTEAETTTAMTSKSDTTVAKLSTTDRVDDTSLSESPTITSVNIAYPTTSINTTYSTTTSDESTDPITKIFKTTLPTITSVKPTDTTTTVKTTYSTTTSVKPIDTTTTVKTTYSTTTSVKTTHPTAVKHTTSIKRTHSSTHLDKEVTPAVPIEVRSETTEAFTNSKSHYCDQDAEKQTWVEQYGTLILWPILALAIIFIIMLLIWRRKSVVYFFIGKNYVVNGNVRHDEGFSKEVYYNKKDENVDCLKELI